MYLIQKEIYIKNMHTGKNTRSDFIKICELKDLSKQTYAFEKTACIKIIKLVKTCSLVELEK